MEAPDELVRIGEGVQAEVFLRPDGTVLKLWRSPTGQAAVEREATALRALSAYGSMAPGLVGVVEARGRPGLVMERVEGGGLAAALRSRPWSVGRTATTLARCHATIHALSAPVGLPALNDELRQRIQCSDRIPAHVAAFVLEVLADLPPGDRLCHGDFHVANVLGTSERPIVIDWPNATRGDPDADVAHTNVLHRFGRPREGTNRLERGVVNLGRAAFGSRYLSAYLSLRPIEPARLERWEIVRAAARLATAVAGEAPGLLRFLAQRRVDLAG